jgi:hypothetical protein
MNIIQRRGLGLACLVLASLSSTAQADTVTGKITSYHLNTTASGDRYTVGINGYMLSSGVGAGELLREAFLRQLTVTVYFNPSGFLPYTGPTGNIYTVNIKATDLP